MPYYYDISLTSVTNGTTNTDNVHMLALTAANQETMRLVELGIGAVFTTAGSGYMKARTGATAGSGGTAFTATPRNARNPAAATVITTDDGAGVGITPGGTLKNRIIVGFSQNGNGGAWAALNADHAVARQANAGANGNLEVATRALTATVIIALGAGFSEG